MKMNSFGCCRITSLGEGRSDIEPAMLLAPNGVSGGFSLKSDGG